MDATRNPLPCAILLHAFLRIFGLWIGLEPRPWPMRHSAAVADYLFIEPGMARSPAFCDGASLFCALENRLQQISVRTRLGHRDEQQPRDRAAQVRIVIDAA